MNGSLSELLHHLKQLGSKERAIWDQSYHKSKREHWGVPAVASEQYALSLLGVFGLESALPLARALWKTDLFDPMICAARILSSSKVNPSSAIWNLIVDFLTQVDGWALEDQLAPAARKCILADESLLDELEKWTYHENFWIRRAALVYTLPYAKPNFDPERMLSWAARYATDPEWFIQKAIGWWLRVLGEHNPERVILFLETHSDTLKYVAKKEARRKLTS
ncbi:MAG: DNA alkylation repair protein [Simkania sp.]|nr:DNA alkylation repair protein [Simkania sp.]MCP5490355.1 DNA alkylation repair protein [Chlamydiales bacterium]